MRSSSSSLLNFSSLSSLLYVYAFILIIIIHDDCSIQWQTNGQTIENFTTSNLLIKDYYTFNKLNSQIRLSANKNITDKLIHSKKEISFDFR